MFMKQDIFLRKIIREAIEEIAGGSSSLSEFISRDEVSLLHYLNMSDEEKKSGLPHDYYYFFDDFLVENDIEFERPSSGVIDVDGDNVGEEYQDYEIIDWLEQNNKELFNQFADYLYSRVSKNTLPVPDADYPAWSYFSSGTIVKNQWLIHFTSHVNAFEIYRNGFTRGVDDMNKLGLTTSLGEFDKKYGGFNFCYTIPDFKRYAKAGGYGREYKYGDSAVLFRASGVRTWHHGDEEYQTIFYGNTASNIIPIIEYDGVWQTSPNKGNMNKTEKLDDLVDWIIHNYDQYRKTLNKSF